MTALRRPSRQQLASFLPTPELVRTFEGLFTAAEGGASVPDLSGVVLTLRAAITALELAPSPVALAAASDESMGAPVDGAAVPGWAHAVWCVRTFLGVGVDETVTHTLGVAPAGLLQVRLPLVTNPGVVYFGSVAPTTSAVTLRSTFAGQQVAILYA